MPPPCITPSHTTTRSFQSATIFRAVRLVLTALTGSIPARIYAGAAAVALTIATIAYRATPRKTIVGAGTTAIACILIGAFRARIPTVAAICCKAIVGTGTTAIACILIGAFTARIPTVAAICCKAIVRTGTSTIAIILMGAFAARIATGGHVRKMIRLTVTTAIAGVLPRTLGRRIATACTSSVIAFTVVGAFIAGFTAIVITIGAGARVCAGNTAARIAGFTAITKKAIVTICVHLAYWAKATAVFDAFKAVRIATAT